MKLQDVFLGIVAVLFSCLLMLVFCFTLLFVPVGTYKDFYMGAHFMSLEDAKTALGEKGLYIRKKKGVYSYRITDTLLTNAENNVNLLITGQQLEMADDVEHLLDIAYQSNRQVR